MRAQVITREIKKHDRELFCRPDHRGVLQILRRKTVPHVYDINGTEIIVPLDAPALIMALTDTWQPNGRPVDWGLLPILARLQEVDGHNRDVLAEIYEQREKQEQKNRRAIKHEAEEFARANRDSFREAFKDVNVSSLDKKPKKTEI